MAGKGRGKLLEYTPGKVVLYIPAAVARDTAFPIQPGDYVTVRIDGKRIIVEPEK